MAASNYHNKQNFSEFGSPDNNSDALRRNFKFEDKKNADDYQKKLEDVLSQLKKKDKEPENPFYDNTYKHNLNIPRGKQPEMSLDFRNQQLPSISRLSDRAPGSVRNDRKEPERKVGSQEIVEVERRPVHQKSDVSLLRDYDKRTMQLNNNKGGFFDSLGENSRHKNMIKEYQDYMRSNPIPPPKNKKLDDFEERDRVSLRKKSEHNKQEKDWYSKDIGVGILPGMGGMLDHRRHGAAEPQRRQVTGDYKSPQDKFYDYEPPERMRRGHSGVYDAPRGMAEMAVGRGDMQNRMSMDAPASRLAGIGSRIMDSERLPNYDNMRTPQYTPNRDAMKFKFTTPQVQKESLEMGPNLAGKFRDMQGYSGDMDSYTRQGSDRKGDYEDFRDVPRDMREFPNEAKYQNINRPERRGQRDNDNNANNANWLEERQRQELDKRDKQKEELQRAYREQIEEKKRKKDEEQRRQMAEEKKEEERLRRENEDLQRQFQLELQKKREAEEEAVKAKKNDAEDDYTAATNRRLMKKLKNKGLEPSADNTMRKEVPVVPSGIQDYGVEHKLKFEDEKLRLDDFGQDFGQDYRQEYRQNLAKKFEENLDKKTPMYEFSRDPEMEVQRDITRKMNATLDDQLERMKKDVEYHAKMLRTELTSYKTQAMVSQELRHNAQKELERLRDDLKHQQVQANREPVIPPEPFNEKNYMNSGKGQRLDTDRSAEKMNLKLPTKNYAKLYSPDDDGPNLELPASGGLTLDFETKYLPAREGGNYDLFKEAPKLNQVMKKYGIDEEDSGKLKQKNDNAMKKFDMMFPKHGNANKVLVKQDSISAIEDKFSAPLDLGDLRYNAGEVGHYYPKKSTKPVEKPVVKSSRKKVEDDDTESGDEIERIEKLLQKYRADIKFREDEEKEKKEEKKPVLKSVKDVQAGSNKKIPNEVEQERSAGAGGSSGQKVIKAEGQKMVYNGGHVNEEDGEDYELKDFEMNDDEEEIQMGQEKEQINIAHHVGELEDDNVMVNDKKGQINVTHHVGELEDE